MRILLVEDEYRLADALAQILKLHNYSIDVSYDGETGLDYALSNVYDLLILDIMLPKRDGISILQEVRKTNLVIPVLLLTARSEIEDRVNGLDMGADDYLVKPFNTEELLARIRAILRRKGEIAIGGELNYGNITLNHNKLKLFSEKQEVDITKKEADVLEYLIICKERVISKTQITEKLWGFDSDAEYNNVEVYMSFLRKKLKFLNANIRIRTLRSMGYILEIANDF